MPDARVNLTRLAGRLCERGALRYTPAGIPVLEFVIAHESAQDEQGQTRTVTVEMACIASGATAHLLASAEARADTVAASGFLAARSLKRRTPVLHVTHIEFIED